MHGISQAPNGAAATEGMHPVWCGGVRFCRSNPKKNIRKNPKKPEISPHSSLLGNK
jgi:hypothetical protein